MSSTLALSGLVVSGVFAVGLGIVHLVIPRQLDVALGLGWLAP